MKVKFVSVILALITLISVFSSCAGNKDSNSDTDNTVDYEGIVIDNEYVIIRSQNANKNIVKSASYLYQAINQKASLNVGINTDFYKKEEEIGEKEILIGKTNRETEFDRTTLGQGEYYIGVEGSKIIIDAYDAEVLYYAVKAFTEKWLTKDLGIQKDGVLLINDQICESLNGLDIEPENTFTILSQNVRNHNDGNGNDLVDRFPRFKQMIEKYSPDIVGMQEDNTDWKAYIRKNLLDDYAMIGDASLQNAILYKKERFELLDTGKFWLSDTPNVASKVPESTYNRICNWVLLKDKQSGETILMANTHLDHVKDIAREKQAKILVNYLLNRFADYPIYITGDYNFIPTSIAYGILNKDFQDSCSTALVNKSKTGYTFPAYEANPTKRLDYCFHNDRSTANYYYIVTDDFDGCVSDHYGVITEFVVN